MRNNAQIYEQSLEQARNSLLHSTFDQFWIHQSEISPLIREKSVSVSEDVPLNPPKRNSWRSQKIWLILIVFLLLLCSIPFLIRSQLHSTSYEYQCASLACLSASQRIIENLDVQRNPCENFFAFACAGWSHHRHLSPNEPSKSYFREMTKKNALILYEILQTTSFNRTFTTLMKMKTYINVCMDRTHHERTARDTLLSVLLQMGSSPLIDEHWSIEEWNFVSSLVFLHQHRIYPLFRMTVKIDEKNNQLHRISFEPGTFSFEEKSLYENNDLRSLFNHLGRKLFQALDFSVQTSQLLQSIDELYLFEQRLNRLASRTSTSNPWKSYHLLTYEQMENYFSSWLNIGDYLHQLFHKEKSFFCNQSILFIDLNYFQQLNHLLQTTQKSLLANYFTFRLVQDLLPLMPGRFRQIRRPLIERLRGIAEERSPWEICVKRTDDAFGFATGALFIAKVFDTKTKETIEHMVEEIRQTFLQILPHIHWMDSQTREQAIIKAKLMLNRLGYPQWLENYTVIDLFYEDLSLSSSNNSLINFLLVQRFHKEQNLKKLDMKPDIEEWAMTPIDVNAYYAPLKNMMVFPAGILQTPFFDPNVPIALNFGSIASIIGHELIHAFDASGRFFDGHGNLKNWWQTESARAFEQRAQCFIDQYNLYRLGDQHIDGILTLDENIADNGGLRIAYTAYQRYVERHHRFRLPIEHRQKLLPGLNFTDEQLFFLGFSQTWCTKTTAQAAKTTLISDAHAYPKYRVIGTLSNMPEFSRAFHCQANSSMNPRKRCQLWSQFDQ